MSPNTAYVTLFAVSPNSSTRSTAWPGSTSGTVDSMTRQSLRSLRLTRKSLIPIEDARTPGPGGTGQSGITGLKRCRRWTRTQDPRIKDRYCELAFLIDADDLPLPDFPTTVSSSMCWLWHPGA
jgi:hypothetical protein